jgi:hypothetical protein
MLEGLDDISEELARRLAELEALLDGGDRGRPSSDAPAPAVPTAPIHLDVGVGSAEIERIWTRLRELSEELERARGQAPRPLAPSPAQRPAERPRPAEVGETFEATTARKLELLGHLIRKHDSVFEPELDAHAPMGHIHADVDERLELPPGGSFPVLEELADLGLLQRELVNRVHLCADCSRCQINFREQCPSCESIDLQLESLVHHFRCGYTGLESEFVNGFELFCPKCRRQLFQLGQDFDRPHETYLCRACAYMFEEPRVYAQCLSCTQAHPAGACQEARVHRYRPTPLTVRAVELGRLTGLEVNSILYDADLKIATRDFLNFEITREVERLNRYSTPFCTCILQLEHGERVYPIFREWPGPTLRELCVQLARSLRTLDLVTRLDAGRIGILMPETDAEGSEAVRRRLLSFLDSFDLSDHAGHELTVEWIPGAWTDKETTLEQVLEFFGPEEGA